MARTKKSKAAASASTEGKAPKAPRASWKPDVKTQFVGVMAGLYDFNDPAAKERFKMRDSKADKIKSATATLNAQLKVAWEASKAIDPDNTAASPPSYSVDNCVHVVDQMVKDGNKVWKTVRQQHGETGRASSVEEAALLHINGMGKEDALLALWCRSFMKHPTWGIKQSTSTLDVAAQAAAAAAVADGDTAADSSGATSPTASGSIPSRPPSSAGRRQTPASTARPRGVPPPRRASSAPVTPAQAAAGQAGMQAADDDDDGCPMFENKEDEKAYYEERYGRGAMGGPPQDDDDTASSPAKRQRKEPRLNRSSVQLAQMQADAGEKADAVAEEAQDKRQVALIGALGAQSDANIAAQAANVMTMKGAVDGATVAMQNSNALLQSFMNSMLQQQQQGPPQQQQ